VNSHTATALSRILAKDDETSSKWQRVTNRFHAAEITLFLALLFTSCVRRVRATGLSVLLLVPYFVSVVALDFTDLVPEFSKASFPEFLQPIAGALANSTLLAHVIMTYAIPAGKCESVCLVLRSLCIRAMTPRFSDPLRPRCAAGGRRRFAGVCPEQSHRQSRGRTAQKPHRKPVLSALLPGCCPRIRVQPHPRSFQWRR
jgi:hypothetical protein